VLEGLWADLGGEDAKKAFQAVRGFADRPREAVLFLAERLRPPSPQRVNRLLSDLGREDAKKADIARAELVGLGKAIEPAVRKALEGTPVPAAKGRLEQVLKDLAAAPDPVIRGVRAVEALERIGSPAARFALEAVANQAVEERVRAETGAALGRLGGAPRTPVRPPAGLPPAKP
jgi:hypothetical protein